jgi:hypothetical protein
MYHQRNPCQQVVTTAPTHHDSTCTATRPTRSYRHNDIVLLHLALVADEGDEPVPDELTRQLARLVDAHACRVVAEPVDSAHRREMILVADLLIRRRELSQRETERPVQLLRRCRRLVVPPRVILLLQIVVGELGGVWFPSDEPAEQDLDDRLCDDDLVILTSSFEVEELHADGLGCEDGKEMVGRDAVLGDEAFEDMKAFGGNHVNASIPKGEAAEVRSVFDEVGIHEVLAYPLGHFTGHREGRRRRGGDDAGGVLGVG